MSVDTPLTLPAVEPTLVSLIESLPYALLARAEVSHDLRGGHASLSLYALDPETFARICELSGDSGLAARDARMRKHFALMPRHWIKFTPDQPGDLSEYYQLAEPSMAALRLFLHGMGASAAIDIVDRTFGPLMERKELDWGLVVKRAAGVGSPRISVRLPTHTLARTLQELVRAQAISAAHAQRLRDTARDLHAGSDAYLSFDPFRPSGVAIDIPSPDQTAVERATRSDLGWLHGAISYLKLRYPDGERGEPRWTLYRPAVDAIPSDDRNAYVRRVQRYYDDMNPVIETTFGGTYQAGQLPREDQGYGATETTLTLIARTPIATGSRQLLDLGCGLAGPAIDIARAYPEVHITGVNVSAVQVARARERIDEAGLSDRITVVEADFHHLPFDAASFDGAYAFEALCYAHDPAAVAREVGRVVRAGGWWYAKEPMREEGALGSTALENLAAHDRTYAMRTRTLREHERGWRAADWELQRAASIDDQLSTEAYQLRMFERPDPNRPSMFSAQRLKLTLFGQSHFNEHEELPLYFAEMLAIRPTDPRPEHSPTRSDA